MSQPVSLHKESPSPPPQKVVCIGDIHGHFEKLSKLWRNLQEMLPDFDEYLVVFLGDYVDRGPDVRRTLDFLVNIKKTRPNSVFLCGNHDQALLAFLHLLPPRADGSTSYRDTWDREDIYMRPGEREGWWYNGPGHEEMHLQGRRYGGGRHSSIYNAMETFRSYGLSHGDRAGLLAKMPEEHKKFLQELVFVHEIPGYIFVHAGLESPDCSHMKTDIEGQLQLMRRRDSSVPRLEPLAGRDYVWDAPQQLVKNRVCVVSGHHGDVHFGPYRIIMDRSGGRAAGRLECVVLPDMVTLDELGQRGEVPRDTVFV